MLGPVPASRRANAFADALDERRPGGGPAEQITAERSLDQTDQETAPAPRGTGRTDERGRLSRSEPPAPPDLSATPAPPHDGATGVDQETPRLVALAQELGALPRPELSAEAKTTQRAQLLAALENTQAGNAPRVPEQRRPGSHRGGPVSALIRLRPKTRLGRGLAAGGLSIGVAAGALGGAAAAASGALPGDTLYGLKRGVEDLRMDLTSGDTSRGELHLRNAATRLHETRRLLERQKSGALDEGQLDEVRRTLASMQRDAEEGHRLLSGAYHAGDSIDPLRRLSDFRDEHTGSWAELREQLPLELADIRDEVTSVFDVIEGELRPLRALLPESDDHHNPSGDRSATKDEPAAEAAEDEHPEAAPDDPATAEDTTGGDESDAPGQPPGPAAETGPDSGLPGEEGLIGGGLLDPGRETPSSEDAPLPPGQDSGEQPGPEITIPPLIDGLLPELGLGDQQPR